MTRGTYNVHPITMAASEVYRTKNNSLIQTACLVIGVFSLISTVIDIICHLTLLGIMTQGFRCDATVETVGKTVTNWLEPIILILNLGTHGIYPLSALLHYSDTNLVLYYYQRPLVDHAKCHPGMLHVYAVDVLELVLNIFYLIYAIIFIVGVFKESKSSVKTFLTMSYVKFLLYIIFFINIPTWRKEIATEHSVYLVIKILDIGDIYVKSEVIDSRKTKISRKYVEINKEGYEKYIDRQEFLFEFLYWHILYALLATAIFYLVVMEKYYQILKLKEIAEEEDKNVFIETYIRRRHTIMRSGPIMESVPNTCTELEERLESVEKPEIKEIEKDIIIGVDTENLDVESQEPSTSHFDSNFGRPTLIKSLSGDKQKEKFDNV